MYKTLYMRENDVFYVRYLSTVMPTSLGSVGFIFEEKEAGGMALFGRLFIFRRLGRRWLCTVEQIQDCGVSFNARFEQRIDGSGNDS